MNVTIILIEDISEQHAASLNIVVVKFFIYIVGNQKNYCYVLLADVLCGCLNFYVCRYCKNGFGHIAYSLG